MSAVMLKESVKNCAARSEFLLCFCLLSFFYFLVSLVVVVVVLELSSNVTT